MEPNNDFLPQDYEVPASNANYTKLEKGETKIRILSKPIVGWLDWKDKKPLRFPMDKKPSAPVKADQEIKHFWAFVVFNYNTGTIQVMEITQKGIQQTITNLSKDADWGSPFKYDIKIDRQGDDKNSTTYTLKPVPHKELSEEAKAAYMAKPCNLQALFTGGDPFQGSTAEAVKEEPKAEVKAEEVKLEAAAAVVEKKPGDDLPF